MKGGGYRKSRGKDWGDSGLKTVARQECVFKICVDIACNIE